MARPVRQFPILVLDSGEILRYLYATAYARAALEDIRIVTERNVFNIPGHLGNAERIDSASGNPLAVKMKALEYYSIYVQGLHNRQAYGGAGLDKYLKSLVARREEYQQAISKLHQMVDRHNSELLDFFTAAAHTAIKARTFGTVAMAIMGAVAAVSGAAAAAPIAMIYTGAKVIGGVGAGLASSGDGWGTVQAVAMGKYENGVVSVGEGVQPYVDDSLSALSKAWEKEVGRQISSQNRVVVQLERQVAAQTKVLAAHARVRDVAGTARTLRQMNASSAALTAERQVLQRTAASGALRTGAAQAFRRGMPIISLANDLLTAYNDYVDDEAKLESRR